MKKKIILSLCVLCILVIGFMYFNKKEDNDSIVVDMNSIIKMEINLATETGLKTLVIHDNEEIETFINTINDTSKKENTGEFQKGWSAYITLYNKQNNKETSFSLSANTITADKQYFINKSDGNKIIQSINKEYKERKKVYNYAKPTEETFENEYYDSFPDILNIIYYMKLPIDEVKVLNHTEDNLTFCFQTAKTDFYDESILSFENYTKLLEKEYFKVSPTSGTIVAGYILDNDKYKIEILCLSDMNAWKKEADKSYYQNITNENIVVEINRKY